MVTSIWQLALCVAQADGLPHYAGSHITCLYTSLISRYWVPTLCMIKRIKAPASNVPPAIRLGQAAHKTVAVCLKLITRLSIVQIRSFIHSFLQFQFPITCLIRAHNKNGHLSTQNKDRHFLYHENINELTLSA